MLYKGFCGMRVTKYLHYLNMVLIMCLALALALAPPHCYIYIETTFIVIALWFPCRRVGVRLCDAKITKEDDNGQLTFFLF